jgi:enamine deaminase RidA (YjgF/YER057c/UK114 family)
VDRLRVPARTSWADLAGYSRAIRVGDRVDVSGTVAAMPDGADPPADAYGQAVRCLEIIAGALEEAGAGVDDVVRTRMYLVRPGDAEQVLRAHGEVFGEVRPASTLVVVKELIEPRYIVEMEADAVVGPPMSRPS